MTRIFVTLALGAAIASTPAAAQDQPREHGGRHMQDMTRQQAQQMADGMFQRFDLNRDGVVTRQEAEQAAAQFGGRAERMIDRMFVTAQSLTLPQAEAEALARFDRDDLNHDGVVTAAERQQARGRAEGAAATRRAVRSNAVIPRHGTAAASLLTSQRLTYLVFDTKHCL